MVLSTHGSVPTDHQSPSRVRDWSYYLGATLGVLILIAGSWLAMTGTAVLLITAWRVARLLVGGLGL